MKGVHMHYFYIFGSWFTWLTSFAPFIMDWPKGHKSDQKLNLGDIVLFLKGEKESDKKHQYSRVNFLYPGSSGKIRQVKPWYKNHNEDTIRTTKRGAQDSVDELPIYERLSKVWNNRLFANLYIFVFPKGTMSKYWLRPSDSRTFQLKRQRQRHLFPSLFKETVVI